jgi:hypothetical protein
MPGAPRSGSSWSAAVVAGGALRSHFDREDWPRRVIFVCFDEATLDCCRAALDFDPA